MTRKIYSCLQPIVLSASQLYGISFYIHINAPAWKQARLPLSGWDGDMGCRVIGIIVGGGAKDHHPACS
jgi:hypothetical protein